MPFFSLSGSRLLLLVALLCLPALSSVLAQDALPPSRAGAIAPAQPFAESLTAVLEKIVTDEGLVRYDVLQSEQAESFRSVLKSVEMADPDTLSSPAAALAFWMNAYNVQMLQHILEHPDLDHIIDEGMAPSFFETPLRTASLALSLNTLENVLLREQEASPTLAPYQIDLDPRIHVGLNCAALSCPPLIDEAFTAVTVDSLLDLNMRRFVNAPTHIRLEGSTVVLSSLLDWFGSDFDATGVPAGTYLVSYMDPQRPDYEALRELLDGQSSATLRARENVRYAYDWTVNRAPGS